MKKILGLDLGTNSIGWALVEIDHENRIVRILGLGSRILTMDAGEISKFESGGKLESAAAQKTKDKTNRKLNERFLLRRDRLHCVLNLLETLPSHYQVSIDFENDKGYRSGKFKKDIKEKLAYVKDENGKSQFLFNNSYNEMVSEFKEKNSSLFYKKKNGNETKIPYDWTLYYLRKKALVKEITKEELAWITLSFNQKRGYEKTIGQDEKKQKEGELSEIFVGKVTSVNEVGESGGLKTFEIVLVDENDNEIYRYKEECLAQITFKDDLKEVEKISKYDADGDIDPQNTVYIVKEIRKIKIVDVKYTDRKNKENLIFEVVLSTGWIKEQQSKYLPKWKDTERDFIIKTTYDIEGNRILKGSDKGRNINIPKDEDWTLLKLKTETALSSFNAKNKTVGVASYIYNELLKNSNQKIKGDLVTVIERKFYREELEKIFECQKQFHPELRDVELYKKAINLLYPHNESHRKELEKFLDNEKIIPFSKLIADDVILYQRDLKSKKSLISNCIYEKERFIKIEKKTGRKYQEPLKAIHKANPLYQEFRIWQFIKRLKIIQYEVKNENEILVNQDVSESILTNENKENLFEFLNNKEYITQSALLKYLGLSDKEFKWNYEAEHKEPCNETRYNFILRLKRIKGFDWKSFLTFKTEYRIWHFFYSVKKQDEFSKGLKTLFEKLVNENNMSLDFKDDLVKNFTSFGGYANDYGTYSEKAIKKLLPFLRIGKYCSDDDILEYKSRIDSILTRVNSINSKDHINSIVDDEISKGTINSFWGYKSISDFQGLAIHQACYLVYNRYSEVGDLQYWTTPYHIENYLRNEFKQHSLNNPVVEKILVETLQLVKDIWIYYGVKNGLDENGRIIYDKLFDRIHIELGREMKKNAKERDRESRKNYENQKANERIIELLKELRNENTDIKVKSPFQQEKLRILEEGVLSSIEYDKDSTIYNLKNEEGNITKKEIREIISKEISKISKKDFERYRLWLDQRYQSPYTGKLIKLSDLFNREKYEIEHIFPQERITLNALYNKVICETEVNKEKRALTGYQFILASNGSRTIKCAAHDNKEIDILSANAYEKLVKLNFTDKRKQEILLSKEIPENFTNSQLNNSQYIAKMAMKLLSNVVRDENEDSFRSKNVLPVTGVITSRLKQDWQLNDAWNELIQPRFERLNRLTNSNFFGNFEKRNGHNVFINRLPEGLSNNFDKKRIDHRHHALDALVIALVTENHVNYLNNIYSMDSKEDKFEHRVKIKNKLTYNKKDDDGEKSRYFLPPAQYKRDGQIVDFAYEFADIHKNIFKDIALEALQNVIVSFKQKSRIIKQRTNKIRKWDDSESIFKIVTQEKLNNKENYNIRQSLHKATFYGKVKLENKNKIVPINVAINQYDMIIDNNIKSIIIDLKEVKRLSNQEIIKLLEEKYPQMKIYEAYVATRYDNFLESFANIPADKIIATIDAVTDTGIQKILINHIGKTKNVKEDGSFTYQPDIAFSYDGVKELNKNIKELNGNKNHKPIFKVRIKSPLGTKFSVSDEGEKSNKYVTTAADSNLFCGFYENEQGERKFTVPTLRETIENLKQGNPPCKDVIFDEKTQEKFELIFVLSPNDLVYLPYDNESINAVNIKNFSKEQINRIYKFRDASINKEGGLQVNFVPFAWANMIFKKDKNSPKILLENGKELQGEVALTSDKDKSQNSIDDNMQIRATCIKLRLDRLGMLSLLKVSDQI